MGKAGTMLLPGNLDPRAEEFRPLNPCGLAWTSQFQPRIFYPFHFSNDVHVQAVCPSPPPPPPSYFSHSGETFPPLPATLPPPAASPTRALLLASVTADASESLVRWELEVFGEVRAVQMERVREGIVAVHFYDLRDALQAITAIQQQQQARLLATYRCDAAAVLSYYSACWGEDTQAIAPLSTRGLIAGRPVWAQFMVPATSAYPDGRNQGSLVLFNLPPSVTSRRLRDIFEAFGAVRELRGAPLTRGQRFVEFFDVRDARRALEKMDGKLINGKNVVIDFSRPGGSHYNATPRNSFSANDNQLFDIPSSASFGAASARASPTPLLSRKLSGRSATATRKSSKVVDGTGTVLAIGRDALESSVAALSLSNVSAAVVNGLRVHGEKRKKNAKKSSHRPAIADYSTYAPSPKSRMSKSKRRGGGDARFTIKDDITVDEVGGGDSRTTLMIKNIPNKYSQILLLNLMDNHCVHCNEHIADDEPLSAFDFLYLPIDFNNECNVGYGFVNMTTPQAARKLYNALHLKPWAVFNSKKICEITYARLQGLEALKEHFKSSRFGCVAENYLPVVFSPPRDGRQLTEPLAIACRVAFPTPPSSSSYNTGSVAGLISYSTEGTDDLEEMDGGDGLQHALSDDVDGPDEGGVGLEYGGCRNDGNGGGSNLCTVVSVA